MNLSAPTHFPPIPREPATRLMEALPRWQAPAKRESPRVAIKVKGKILFINLGDVVSVKAEGNYVLLQRASTSHLLHESISTVAEKLQPHGFIRIHRSMLVNATFVEEIMPYSTGEYGLRLKDRQEYRVTRTYKQNLKLLAEFWLGAGGFFLD
ncbi:MAG TPA: LytTR family DNA-binding domain-containing protein [Candidatus Acidoferrales bacterium]|nr:LytTR family DNA-binding domain-containing protein [Candidatus Acidoferrales bacterium]